jgi:23S rRNA (uracil1939-C5)-methyltransferase
LDLFCGLGNFTIPLAKRAKRVVGVEGEASMVARVLENAALNQCDNVEAYCADLSQDCSAEPWAKKSYSKLLIDPARAGAEEIIGLIAQLNPEKIVYVSCNPATLARDTGLLGVAGYTLESAGIMDMFTHTHHTEAMGLFIRD